MRILPDKPSLDFLRREAKDLRAVLREARPGATLADAQRALARQYGMHDWNALKAEAEQRAAHAPVAPDGLADALAAAFGLGRVLTAASPVSFTPMGRCWSIITDRGRWLVGTVYPWITNEQAETGAQLRDAAVAAGVAAPTPVRSVSGRLVEVVQGQSWRVHEWIDVGPSPVTPTPAAVAGRVGSMYGTLHRLAIPSHAPIHPYLTDRRPHAECDKLLVRARAAHKPWAEQLSQALPTLFELYTITADADTDEVMLCNCNLIPENVRIGHNDELVLTVWEFARPLTPRLELGSALVHWTLQPSVSRSTITAFRDGYVRTAGQWPRLDLASFAVAVTSWLNWTYNTICEALDTVDNDLTAFADREAVGLLNHPMTRSSLQQILMQQDT